MSGDIPLVNLRATHTVPVEDVPNGGKATWLKVLGCFMIWINTWGIAISFGVYQAHYQLHTFQNYAPSTISWIGTTQVFLMGFTAILAGALFDRGYARVILCVGCGLLVFGLFMLSIARTFWQVMLSQSVCMGLGNGLTYVPAVSIVSNSFSTRRPIAIGLAATGAAVGGTILPVLFKVLTPAVGFGWTNRIFGCIILVTSLLGITLLQPGSRRSRERHSTFLDIGALREPPYICLCVGIFFLELGFWIPGFIIAPYAQLSLDTSAGYAFDLVAIMNAGSFAGRVLPAYVAQIKRVGPAWVLFTGALSLGILVLSWIGIHDVAGITVWAIFSGFMNGIVVSMPNTVLAKLSPYATYGARSGMMWTFAAFAALIGAPLAGVLVDKRTNNYRYGQLFSGLSICLGAAMLCVPAVHVMRKRLD